jgi:hypothetical protein
MKFANTLYSVQSALNGLSVSYQSRHQARINKAAKQIMNFKPSIREDGGLYLGFVPFAGLNGSSASSLKSRLRKRGVRYLANSRTNRSLRVRLYGMMRSSDTSVSEYHFMTLTVSNHVRYNAQSYEFDKLAGIVREKFIQNLRKNYGLSCYVQAAER